MAILIEKAKSLVNQIVYAIEKRIEFLREKLDGFLGTYPVYQGLVYTEEEEELILQTEMIVKDYFASSPGQCLISEDYESRCEAIEDYGSRLIELYGLDGVEIIITDTLDKFSDRDAVFLFGYADFSDNCIYINANYLRSNDPTILEHIASTVIHELRHFIQYRVAKMEKTYGVPYDRRHAWRVNLVNYIEPEYDMEGYSKQPIEFDARNFTNRIWQGIYGVNV